MARVIVSEAAYADQTAILTDLQHKAGARTVSKFGDLFDGLYERLRAHPASGAQRPGLGPDVRVGIVFPFVVIYAHSVADDTVTIPRIVHGHRKISGGLLEQDA